MNPVFWLLTLLVVAAVWFLLRGIFIRLGQMFSDTMNDTKRILSSDTTKENTEENNGGNDNA